MELVEKYLQAVKFWLPSSQEQDIAAELRDDIRSEMEERERTLGRTLNPAEVEAILKQRGRPLLVAEKYLPQRFLIGPVLFPPYWFVLKIVLLCYLVPWIAIWIGLVSFKPEYRAHHLGLAAIQDAFVLWVNGWIAFSVVTFVFAVLERVKDQSWLTDNWSPRRLPLVRDTQRISRAGSAIELIAAVIFGLWWLRILWTLTVFDAAGLSVTLPAAWHKFFWVFLPIWVFSTSLSGINLLRPYWTRQRRAMKAALNFVTAVALFFVAREFTPVLGQGPANAGDRVATLSWAITFGLAVSFAIGTLVCLILAFVDAWRALKAKPALPQLKQSIAI